MSTAQLFVNLKAIKYTLARENEATVFSRRLATVLLKSIWRRGIIKDEMRVGSRHGGPCSVWNWPSKKRESFSLAALSPGAPSFPFSAHSRRTLRSQSGRLHADIYQQTFPQQNPISVAL